MLTFVTNTIFLHVHFIWSERPRRFGLVFSRARLCRYVGLGICLYSPGKGATQVIVWEQRSLVVIFD